MSLLTFDFGSEIDVGDEEGILFFIAGFLSKSEIKKLSCESCTQLFIKSRETPEIDIGDLGDKKEEFLDQINCGGLCTPSDLLYVCVLHARQLFKEIFDKGEIEKKFLEFENPRSVFAACFELKFSGKIKSIVTRIFNIFSKNFTAELNDKIHMERKRSQKADSKENSASRKIKKLQSESN